MKFRVRPYPTWVTFSVTLCVRSLTLGAIMVLSEEGGDVFFFSVLTSEKFRVSCGILLMVLYLLRFESDVEPRRLDLIWLKGPKKSENMRKDSIKRNTRMRWSWMSYYNDPWPRDLSSNMIKCSHLIPRLQGLALSSAIRGSLWMSEDKTGLLVCTQRENSSLGYMLADNFY